MESRLALGNWDLNAAQAQGLLRVLSRVYETAALPLLVDVPPKQSERVLVLNDGIARTIDLPGPRAVDRVRLVFYLRDLLMRHYWLVPILKSEGLGLRTVFAGGQRVQYAPIRITGESVLHYRGEPSDWGKQILRQELVYHPAQFQMNTAFSRAYVIESAGSRQGIQLNRAYVEETCIEVLQQAMPGCVNVRGDSSSGQICIEWNGQLMFHMSYDSTLSVEKASLKSRVFQLSDFVIHEAFEGEKTEIPLEPIAIEHCSNELVGEDGIIKLKQIRRNACEYEVGK